MKPHPNYQNTTRSAKTRLILVLSDSRLNGRRRSTHDLINLLAISEEGKSRHGAHTEFLRNIWKLIDVEFVEADIGVFRLVAVFLDLGSDGDAGAAPGCEAVDYDEFLGVCGGGGGRADEVLKVLATGWKICI